MCEINKLKQKVEENTKRQQELMPIINKGTAAKKEYDRIERNTRNINLKIMEMGKVKRKSL